MVPQNMRIPVSKRREAVFMMIQRRRNRRRRYLQLSREILHLIESIFGHELLPLLLPDVSAASYHFPGQSLTNTPWKHPPKKRITLDNSTDKKIVFVPPLSTISCTRCGPPRLEAEAWHPLCSLPQNPTATTVQERLAVSGL